jgi:cellulose synthase/poly-beta-1,6-N-acetylglucosamine synthase-like glycosyltransferase
MIEPLLWALSAWPALATLVLLIELAAAQWPARPLPVGTVPRIAILIPAHDEAAGIAATVEAIRAAAPAGSRLLVVADNCSDTTADRARGAGAEVIERDDPARHGKGHALAFARAWLTTDPPEAVIVIDADCRAEGDAIARLAAAAHATGRPVQACYLLRPRPDLGAMVGLSGFAFLLRNLVRQRGLARLGAPGLLTGSGMALPWHGFAALPLAGGDLAEDLALGIAFACAGHPPAFLADARIWSDPARRSATLAQRRRWEHGFLRTAFAAALPLAARGRWIGFHLLVPPLALLLAADLAVLALLAGQAASLRFAILAGLLAGVVLLVLLSWLRFGRAQVSGGRLLLAPFYMLWKLPIHVTAIVRPERRWVRTERP